MLQSINVKYWNVGRDIGLDDSQELCGSMYLQWYHRGGQRIPFINTSISYMTTAVTLGSVYLFMSTQGSTLCSICSLRYGKNSSNDDGTRISTDCLYTILENIYYVHKYTEHYLYGTVRNDCGLQNCAIKKINNLWWVCFLILKPAYATNHFSLERLCSCRDLVYKLM